MHRIALALLALLAPATAWASCPAVSTDCPSLTANNATLGGNVTVGGAATLTGVTTLSAAGTALTVNNNSTLKGTLTLGGGGAGSAALTQSGSGNFVVTLGGSASILNFKSSGGTSLLQLGSSASNIQAKTQLQLAPAAVWSGNANSANSMLYANVIWTGTTTAVGEQSLIFKATADTIDASASDSLILDRVSMTFGGAAKGNRHAGEFTAQYTSTMASAGLNQTFTALNTKLIGSANDGGTGTTPATASGQGFGFNPVCTLQAGATNWASCVGSEIDLDVESGASVMDKIGLQIVQVTADVVAGSRDDIALSFNNQPTGPLGWNALISVGRLGGYSPLSSTGWVMQFTPHLGVGTIAGGGGLDFTNFVPTTAFMRGNNFLLDPSGNWTANSYKVGSNQVVGARITGWGAGTNGARTAFNGSTATLGQTSAAVAQLIADLTTHGLIGP